MTQETLALNSGINVSFLGDIERNTKKPSIESLEKLLNGLGITFQEFFNFEADIKPLKECTALEKINVKLQDRPDAEVEMIYGVIHQIISYNDDKPAKP